MAKDTHDHGKKADHGHGHKPAHEPAPPRLEGGELPEHQRQAQATHAEPPPKPVKLRPTLDEAGQPIDQPPAPPAAAPEPVPRVIDQSERSPDPEKLRRFKVRCDQPFGAQPTRYILAKKGDKQGAIDHYLEKTGIKAVMDTYPEGQAPRPMMAVKELPD